MDLFIQAFISFGSYLMLTYFIYSILNRNKTIPMVIFVFLLISETVQLIRWINLGANITIIIFGIMRYLLPVVLAFVIFIRLTGGLNVPKLQTTKKLKGIQTDVQTSYQTTLLSTLLGVFGIVFGFLGYLFVEDWSKYLIMGFSVIILIVGIYFFMKQSLIQTEQVILIIGRDDKRYYTYDVPKKKLSVKINDFFKNDQYIVDPIGKIISFDDNKKTHIYYVYWVATNDKIDMLKEKELRESHLSFTQIFDSFEKYHYRIITIVEDSKGRIEIKSNKKIK
ncbi:MAG: hypothetical protein EP317_02540 [Bacillota bacterium]|nr:MAG: hypothetical protein EP317_02540 [Bacillota bacterium]